MTALAAAEMAENKGDNNAALPAADSVGPKPFVRWVKEAALVFWPALGYLIWWAISPLAGVAEFGTGKWSFEDGFTNFQVAIICGTWVILTFILWIENTAFSAVLICFPLLFYTPSLIIIAILGISGCTASDDGPICLVIAPIATSLAGIALLSLFVAYFWVPFGLLVWLVLKCINWLSPPAPPCIAEIDDAPGSWDHLRWPEADQKGNYFNDPAPRSPVSPSDNDKGADKKE